MADLTDDELLDALGVSAKPIKARSRTARDERIIAGFEDILRFYDVHKRPPEHGEGRDIFERIYAVRLDRLRAQSDCVELLREYDTHGLLDASTAHATVDALADDDLLAELGVTAVGEAGEDITTLRHVVSTEERRAAEEIANRAKCEDFETFKPLFEQVRNDMVAGIRSTREFQRTAEIRQGEYFIVGGQVAYVAEIGDEFLTEYDRKDRRVRVVYDNGTETNLLARSLQKALYRDGAGRRITNPSAGPLFGDSFEEDDLESGTIYVLRSLSDHPTIAAHRELIHKIGVTGGSVQNRIAGAKLDATYLLADVEVVATYKLANINRTKLEKLFHRTFAAAQLDLEIPDRFGNMVRPKEWFLVPLQVINEVVERLKDQSLPRLEYDPQSATLKEI